MRARCTSCDWYAEFEGVCCNGDSPFCADAPPYPGDMACGYWEERSNDRIAGAEASSGAAEGHH